ncbi:hypothetical protein BGZ63DRAFT_354217 [Mariannaea sp. PMI_226]|nr:hypothetical protein BGZ63DRAFT_354217 [Mariannaea sp. PMI_226]
MGHADLGTQLGQEVPVTEASSSREKLWPNEYAHLEPSRWWFLSAAFPMIAGTLGPVASAFSICTLAEPWRQHLVPGGDAQKAPFIANPLWLTILNAVQLVIAVVSNVVLLLNMGRRLRYNIAQPITIGGWYISAICRISLSATAAGPLLEDLSFPQNELLWSQSFYYSIWAAILYALDASFLAVTFWGASSGHYEKNMILSSTHRTLMLQTILFHSYLLIGARIFSQLENWNFLDAIYWADVTFFTIGFGDYAPETTLGRALLIPYAIFGIISLGLVITSIGSLISERAGRRFQARIEEKTRRRTIRTMTRRGDDDVLRPIHASYSTPQIQPGKLPTTEFERRRAEFSLMRKIQDRASSRRRWVAMVISAICWLILWVGGAAVFERSEKGYQNWSFFEAFYFCFEAWTTIGYGDLTPVSNAGKSFFVFWSILALPTMTALISHASVTVVQLIKNATILLGNITILPGDEGFSHNLKHIVSKLTFGKAFRSYLESAIPGPSKNINQHIAGIETESCGQALQDNDGGCPSTHIDVQNVSRSCRQHCIYHPSRLSLPRLRSPGKVFPTTTEFQFILISEIQLIATNLKKSQSHRYTFEQWAWYLSLIGEDEHNARTHCQAEPRDTSQHRNDQDVGGDLMWSWVGHHSPLMGVQEEGEWILERLIYTLRESLSSQRTDHPANDARKAYEETPVV